MANRNKKKFQRQLNGRSGARWLWITLATAAALALLLVALYQIPAIQNRAYYYVAKAHARIQYFFKPPGEKAFNPGGKGTLQPEVAATLTAMAPTPTPTPAFTSTPTPHPTQQAIFTPTATLPPTPTSTPIPRSKNLPGIKYERQVFNNCGPTNLAMLLSYWGWEGDQHVVEQVIKPLKEDRNVMPYEMLDYVNAQTSLTGIVRYAGDIEMVKKLVAAGFPVLVERGYMNAKEGWMGHYGIITTYDDVTQKVNIPDSFLGDITLPYDLVSMYWNQFDGIYLVIYPYEREQEIINILGPQWDAEYNLRYALEKTADWIDTLEGRELFFAWYSRGNILIEMKDYAGAAEAYDEAFAVYEEIPTHERPWRVFWYQTGPFFAYFYTARYNDVLNLANYVLDITPEDAIPETWVWRGRANKMLGNWSAAESDFRKALEWHPEWWVAENELINMGLTP